ncbi:MAG: hypothetical protein GY940_09320, partial [bacterium]|nr:hypothetical protein [bacterium]
MFYLRNVDDDFDGYHYLVWFYHQNSHKSYETIYVSFRDVSWVSANSCSMLGAIFDKLASSFNTIKILELANKNVKEILERNGFLAFLGYPKNHDYKGTTIQYLKLDPGHSRFFSKYIQDDLMSKTAMPQMSERLKKKFTEGIYEIFINAVMHSKTEYGIFTCGQFYTKKKEIRFMVADL